MKIAITGMAGFIGYHLAQKLWREGHEVVGFDNFNDYYDPELKQARADSLSAMGIEVGIGDLTLRHSLYHWMYNNKPDVVVHLAAYAGVRHSLDNPDSYIENNIMGSHNLIGVCNELGIDKIVYASTSCVCAGNEMPWNEEQKLGHQLNPYGYTKACNEAMFMSSKIKSTIGLRFFTVYGPWGRPDMALFDFADKIVAGEPITLFNYGDMIRDFTYVDDIVQGINIVVDHIDEENEVNEIYNIGYGAQVKLMDFVENIEKQLGRTAEKSFVPKHPADTYATWSDTTKLRKLGYEPTTSIEDGVEKFATWYKEYYGVN